MVNLVVTLLAGTLISAHKTVPANYVSMKPRPVAKVCPAWNPEACETFLHETKTLYFAQWTKFNPKTGQTENANRNLHTKCVGEGWEVTCESFVETHFVGITGVESY